MDSSFVRSLYLGRPSDRLGSVRFRSTQIRYLGLVSWVVSLRRGGVGRLVGDERFSVNGGGGCGDTGDVAVSCMGALNGLGIVGGGLMQLACVWRHSSCR